jgi:hypothetical protein
MKRNTVARLTTLAVLVGSICSVNATIYPGTIEQYVADIQATRHDLNQAADVNRRYKNTHNQIAMLTDAEIKEWSNAGQTMNIASRHMADLQAVTGFTPALMQPPQPMKAPTPIPQASDRAAADAAADESADADSAGGSDRAAADAAADESADPDSAGGSDRAAADAAADESADPDPQAVPTVQQQTPQPMKAPTLTRRRFRRAAADAAADESADPDSAGGSDRAAADASR